MALQIDKIRMSRGGGGITYYLDDEDEALCYPLPVTPRFRINADGRPAFSFFKYISPIDRPDGRKGGAWLVFDAELTLTEEQKQAVLLEHQAELDQRYAGTGRPAPQAKFGAITYTRGTTEISIEKKTSGFIEHVYNPGEPSLAGKNITPFTVELTSEGATFFEQALQNQGGTVQVIYAMYASVRLPPVKVDISFNASKFYSFVQDFQLTTETRGVFNDIWRWFFGGSAQNERKVSDTITEIASQHEFGRIVVDMGGVKAAGAEKATDELRQKLYDWAFNTFSEAVKRMAIEPIKQLSEEERKPPGDVTEFKKALSNIKTSSFAIHFTERMVVEWPMPFRGTLDPIVNLKDKDGQPLKWKDYAQTINLDDPEFRTLDVTVRVSADFQNLPLHSVKIHLDYDAGTSHRIQEFTINNPDTMEKFQAYIGEGTRSYSYWYEVNYKGESRSLRSPTMTTNETNLLINVGDTGILAVDIERGDVDFEHVPDALVTFKYQDSDHGVNPIERQFHVTKDNHKHSLREVIFVPVSKPYQYQIKYTLADGMELTGPEQETSSQNIYINDPFSQTKTISLRAVGNLETEIQTIYVDVRFVDQKNNYRKSTSVALSKAQPFFDWSFPVINPEGKVFYSYSAQFRDGRLQKIPEQEASSNTLFLEPTSFSDLVVTVVPSMVDFTKTQLVDVELHYADPASHIDTRTDFIFEAKDKEKKIWTVRAKDPTKMKYEWQATYYMVDGSTRQTPLKTTEARALIVPVPPA
ncbi:MAG: hypothetical protein JXB05_02775 [Myxococcaceae bacterium]|nr:hypothetical protein [Myxococcaceae bacterium]